MLACTVLAIGPIKTDYWRAALAEYIRRLKPFCRLKIVELPSEKFLASDLSTARRHDSEKIQLWLAEKKAAQVWLLSEFGKQFSSVEFAGALEKKQSQEIIFAIAGAAGWSEEIKKHCDLLSLSKMTLPHELARVVLCEQLYRAVTIINKKTYHY